MSWTRVFLAFLSVLLIAEHGGCKSQPAEAPKGTYVGPIEKTVRLLMRSGRMIETGITSIKDNLEEVASHIPFFKHTRERRAETISDTLNPYKSKIKAIFPGTYWCGDGNISPNKKDLGLFKKTDACCRAHDSCPDGIPAETEREGLLNDGIFTRSSCECDDAFYRCLKEANTLLATDIGLTYFNILKPQCFQVDHPIENCKKYAKRQLLDDKCEEYNYDESKPEILQWFDNPYFR